MIRMTCDPARIESEKTVSTDGRRKTDNLFNQDTKIDVCHTTIGVVQKQYLGDSQDIGRGAELIGTNRSKFALSAMQRGSFAAGEAEHRSRDSLTRQSIDDGAQSKGLVVGVGTHGNQRTEANPRRRCSIGTIGAVPRQPHGEGAVSAVAMLRLQSNLGPIRLIRCQAMIPGPQSVERPRLQPVLQVPDRP